MTPLKTRKQLLPLLALAALLLLFWLVSSTQSVYADNGPQVITPGEGGGNDPPPPNTIEGCVINPRDGSMVAGINVYIYAYMNDHWMATNSTGGFRFQGSWITSNRDYELSINGKTDPWNLGIHLEDGNYGQWYGGVHTNDAAYGRRNILLEPVAIVDVPAAALFSNTGYATVSYEMTQTYYISHSLAFDVFTPSISIGYSQSTTATVGWRFTIDPNSGGKVVRRHYAATYWNEFRPTPGVETTGISGTNNEWMWDFRDVSEYLDPNRDLPWHKETIVDWDKTVEGWYYEEGSNTWSVGTPFAIVYQAFGLTITLDVTVTTSGSNKLDFVIDRHNDANHNSITFWLYTPGAFLDPDQHRGGMEFHIWDMSGAG